MARKLEQNIYFPPLVTKMALFVVIPKIDDWRDCVRDCGWYFLALSAGNQRGILLHTYLPLT